MTDEYSPFVRVGTLPNQVINGLTIDMPDGARRAPDGTPAAVIDVLDAGPGPRRGHQQRIFKEFERSVESAAEQGATFTSWLPLHQTV